MLLLAPFSTMMLATPLIPGMHLIGLKGPEAATLQMKSEVRMSVREWSGVTVAFVGLVWLVAVTGLLWGEALVFAWRARGSTDPVFLVAHPSAWLLYALLAITPPLVLTLHWYRSKGTCAARVAV